MPLFPFKDRSPKLADGVFLAAGACITGDIAVGCGTSIWYNTVLRGDVNCILIGAYTNIQDNCTVQVTDCTPCLIGDYVTVGHGTILCGCTVGDCSLIGMGAIIAKGAQVGKNCIIGAGTSIAEGRIIPSNSLVVGASGRVIRKVTEAEIAAIQSSALEYHKLSLKYCSK